MSIFSVVSLQVFTALLQPHERIMGLDAQVALASIDVTLHLADLYEGLTFPHRPQIVPD